jgi:hypothetical protein
MRLTGYILTILTTLLLIVPSAASQLEYGPDKYSLGVARAIANAGENAMTFTRIFEECPDKWLDGAAFLVSHMPVVDLSVMDYDTFMDNLRLAYEAWETFPYAGGISKDDFFHYVLPYRVSQEPIENWRPFFFKKVKELVAKASTIEEATVAINRWADDVVGFKPTQRRDQGPFETLKSGYGRCEEMMIFFIDACRAAGIPARQAWTPYWAHCDNNHAWTEVMTEDGEWHYVGSCEFAPNLDSAWFNSAARRAALVMSVPFGIPGEEGKDGETELYRVVGGDNPYAIINSTPFYHPTCDLRIELVEEGGEPVPQAKVFVYVFNFGAMRPIAKLETNDDGICSISIGEGYYFISGGNDELRAARVVHALEDEILTYILTLGKIEIEESFWLHYPQPK